MTKKWNRVTDLVAFDIERCARVEYWNNEGEIEDLELTVGNSRIHLNGTRGGFTATLYVAEVLAERDLPSYPFKIVGQLAGIPMSFDAATLEAAEQQIALFASRVRPGECTLVVEARK